MHVMYRLSASWPVSGPSGLFKQGPYNNSAQVMALTVLLLLLRLLFNLCLTG